MKLLFYLEPHPIRKTYDSFVWVGESIAKMLEDEYIHKRFNKSKNLADVRILLSEHYRDLVTEYDKIRPAFIELTSQENKALANYYGEWNQAALDIWCDLMKGEGAVSEYYIDILYRIKKEVFDFDVIVSWSTNGAVKKFAEREGLYTVFMELGCTRAPFFESIYFDPLGTNGGAITRKLAIDLLANSEKSFNICELPFTLVGGQALDGRLNPLIGNHADAIYKDINKNILIPMQLDDDSNVLMYSKYHSVLQFLQDVIPPLVAAGYHCFVKSHPQAVTRKMAAQGHELCRAYCAGYKGQVYWLDCIANNTDYLALIHKMKAVVTINSSVGFEAMLLEKIVIILGESPFNLNGLPDLSAFINNKIDLENYKKQCAGIVNGLVHHYLAPKEWAFEYDYFIERILFATRLYDAYLSMEPNEFTHFFMQEKNNMQNFFLLKRADLSFAFRPDPAMDTQLAIQTCLSAVKKLKTLKKIKKLYLKIVFWYHQRSIKFNEKMSSKLLEEMSISRVCIDEDYYFKTYPDVKYSRYPAYLHYALYGWKEHRNPSKWFDTGFYLECNQDVKEKNINPLVHYIKYGEVEGRTINE